MNKQRPQIIIQRAKVASRKHPLTTSSLSIKERIARCERILDSTDNLNVYDRTMRELKDLKEQQKANQ